MSEEHRVVAGRRRRGNLTAALVVACASAASVALPPRPAAAQSCTAPDFAGPSAVRVGTAPRGIATADFDRDGRMDLVTADFGSDTLTVRWGDGAGGFDVNPTTISTGGSSQPVAVTTADLDQNGTTDIVALLYGRKELLPISKSASGRDFGAWPARSVDDPPLALATGDFDRDGDLDVVTASETGRVQLFFWERGSNVFTSGPTEPVGGFLTGVAVADFDRDGRLDVAVSNRALAEVDLLLDDGAGGWTIRNVPVAPGRPEGIAAGDVDRDGDVDLVVAVLGSNALHVLLGDGAGGITNVASYDTKAEQNGVALADFDGDGALDVAVAQLGARQVTVNLGDGSGKLGDPVPFSVPEGPGQVAIGDFDGNGRPDIAVSAEPADAAVLLVNLFGRPCKNSSFAGAGRLRVPLGGNPTAMATGDWNGDDIPDLATAGVATLSILTGDGTLGFSPPVNLALASGAVPKAIAVADFDLDGDPDLAVASPVATSNLNLFRNTGLTFAPDALLNVGPNPYGVVAGDFNGDGAPDLVTANQGGPSFTFLPGRGDGTFGAAVTTMVGLSGISALGAGDVNGDLVLDVVIASSSNNNVQWWRGDGSGTFFFGATNAVGSGPVAVAVGDLNGDGRPDLVTANSTGNSVSVLLNQGGTGFGAATTFTVGTDPRSVATGDVNGDSRLDLVAANYGSYDVTVLYGNGTGGFPTSATLPGYDQPWPLALLDADRNGRLDVAVANWSFSGGLVVVPGDGAGGFGPRRVSPGPNSRGLATGDFDRDGIADLVTVTSTATGLSFLKGQGDGGFAPGVTFPTGLASPRAVGVGDFDRNGTLDVVVGDGSSGNVVFMRGDGVGGFGAAGTTDTLGSTSSKHIVVGDFDRDGNLDFAKPNSAPGTVSVLFGDGTGAFGSLATPTVGTNPADIAILDFNRDGVPDLAVANYNSNTVSLLEGRGVRATPFTLRESLATGDGPAGLAVGDFDRDGVQDLAVGHLNTGPGTVGVFHGLPAAVPPFFGARSDYALADPTGLQPDGVAVADVNADGRLDLLVACRGGSFEDRSSVRVLMGTGDPTPGSWFGSAEAWTVSQRSPSVIAVEDFDRDGRPDFATAELIAATNWVSVVLNTNCRPRRLRVLQQPARCNTAGTPFPTQPTLQVEDDGANPIECNPTTEPVSAGIIAGTGTAGAILTGQSPLATVSGVASWAGASPPLSIDLAGLKYRLRFGHPRAGLTWSRTLSLPPAITVSGPTAYCAALQASFSTIPGFDTYRWFVDGVGPRGYRPSLTIAGGTFAPPPPNHSVRVDAAADTCPATAALGFTVFADLASVVVSPSGPHTVTTSTTGPSLTVTETGGGTVTHKWGYRSIPGGQITFLPGMVGTSYTIQGADFPGQGTYFVVVETQPQCGVVTNSNEIEVRVLQATADDGAPAFTATSTDNRNRLEWIYPPGVIRARIRYRTAATWNACTPPEDDTLGTADIPDQTDPGAGIGGFEHLSLANDQVYCYSLFTEASPGVFPATTRRTVSGRPFDTSGRVKWAFSTGAAALAPPGLGIGILHVVSDNTLYGIDKATGSWPAGFKPFAAMGPSQSRPANVSIAVGPASHVVFLGSGIGATNNALAVNASTGLGLWGQPLGAPAQAGPGAIFTAFGGAYDYLLLGNRNSSGGSSFFALDPWTGAVAPGWPYVGEPGNEIGIVSSQAAVDYPNRRAYFTSYQWSTDSDAVWCVDLDTAARCAGWADTSSFGNLTASPTLQGGRLYVAALNGSDAEVHALDANDGNPQWASPFAPADGPIKLFVLPDVFTRDLYFSTTDNVWSIRDDVGSATQRWVRYLPGASQPVYFPYDRLVWAGGGDGRLYTLDPTTGLDAALPVTLGEGTAPAGAPTVDSVGRFVYLGTTAGVVYAVALP